MAIQKAVVVHRGARDGYHVARALAERGLLEALVTDLYWPAEANWARACEGALPPGAKSALRARWSDGATSARVRSCWGSGVASLALSKMRRVPFEWQRQATRWCDRTLGEHAGRLATAQGSALLSYSYYGESAFGAYGGQGARVLFQLHPHPRGVREILRRERELHPECGASLDKEWELALPDDEFEQLCGETAMAEHWLAASSFTRQTMVDAGVPAERIHVIPYGTDAARFQSHDSRRRGRGRKLRLLFVGTICQRKGVKYLIQAMKQLAPMGVELLVCGRAVDSLELFAGAEGIEVRPSVSAGELVEAYRTSDVFVFPSLAEGFGHVLLEAMASGLPVVSTARTAAADLVRPGIEGYVVEPGEAAGIVEAVERFLERPALVDEMGEAARARAAQFTWERFREELGDVMTGILAGHTQRKVAAGV